MPELGGVPVQRIPSSLYLRKKKPRLLDDSSSTEAFAGDFSPRIPKALGGCPLIDPGYLALAGSISVDRMGTYLAAADGDADLAMELYLWDRDVSTAFLRDLAILEVALRNAMSAQLARRWGAQWFSNPEMPLDDRSLNALNRAWREITGPKTAGKLVAQCMFGFWRDLLDKGDHAGKDPRRARCNYEVLWRGVLDKAFPGGRAQAKQDSMRWNREYALSVVSRVRALRNRVAHHEPLVNGFPFPGQKLRITTEEAHRDLLKLAAMLDRDLHAFLRDWSQVPDLISQRPKPDPK